jgi:hypothetical protein
MSTPPRRGLLRLGCLGFLLLDCWVLSYGIASWRGGYHLRPELGADTTIPTLIRWQPRPGHRSAESTDALGWLWAPLIALDRAVWHRDIDLASDGGVERLRQAAADGEMHPDDPVAGMLRELGVE